MINIEERLLHIEQLLLIQAKDVLNMDDAAVYTGLSKDYLYKQVSKHRIPFYKSMGGKLTYFKKSELTDWLLCRRVMTTEEAEQAAANYVLTHQRKGGRK